MKTKITIPLLILLLAVAGFATKRPDARHIRPFRKQVSENTAVPSIPGD